MTFIINKNLIFIDSMQFMNSSLEKPGKNVSDDDFKYLTQEFGSKHLELLKQKVVYSYEYIDSFERFSGNKLPDKKRFYRSLKDGHISDEEYLTCIIIWNYFGMKNMGDYHDNYLKKDVLLMADVFGNFTSKSVKFYKLDLSHYFSSPRLSWNAMLKMTGIKLKLISDINMHLFIEKGLREIISYICKRFSEGNNKCIKIMILQKKVNT